MKPVHVEYSRHIDAPAPQIYDIFTDFEDAHVAILPRQYFRELEILEGGQGAGTKYRLTMSVAGQTQQSVMHVSEPVPGRDLLEESEDGKVKTIIRVEPAGQQSHVTILSDFVVEKGPQGWFERLFLPLIIKRIYKEELDNLAAYVAAQGTRPASAF